LFSPRNALQCSRCSHWNPPDSIYCEMCGNPLREISPPSASMGFKLVSDSGTISVREQSRTFGRMDFINMLKQQDDSKYISRQHFQIKQEQGKYYIQDVGSKNGTKLNGVDIRGKGWQEIKPGDKISVADVLELTFQT